VNGIVFFSTWSNPGGYQLFKTDGTAAGTVQLKSLSVGGASGMLRDPVNVAGRLFFSATDPAGKRELWSSDGTSNGTVLIDLSVSPNHAPVAVDDQIDTFEDAPLLIGDPPGVLLNDTDADGDGIAAFLNSPPAHGTLTLGTAGNFTYQPDPNFFGADQVTYHASDGKASSDLATVTINVAPVNDPPTFTVGPDQDVTDDARPNRIVGWTHDASPGPANEATQTLTFHATANLPQLFAVQPQIDATGALTFAPALNAMDDATITVILQDDGGTANGGLNQSAPQTFTIHITKLAPWHNSVNPLDVDGDGKVTPIDPLLVINYVNSLESHHLGPGDPSPPPYYDVNGDNSISPIDALLVIDAVNSAAGGQGESAGGADAALPNNGSSNPPRTTVNSIDFMTLIAMLASDVASHGNPRRRFA